MNSVSQGPAGQTGTLLKSRSVWPAASLVVWAGTSLALLARDPLVHTWTACPILALTGVACPFCGVLRSWHQAMSGQWASAWDFNPLGIMLAWGVPVALLVFLAWTRKKGTRSKVQAPNPVGKATSPQSGRADSVKASPVA